MSGIGFHSLTGAWLFLLALPIIVFYFLKLRRQRLPVSSLLLWRQVIEDRRVNSPFQKFKKHLLLFLQLLLLCLLALAFMQPHLQGQAEKAQYLPILIDVSASMGAIDPETEQTRFEIVQEEARRIIEGLLPGQKVSLISVGETAQRLSEFTDDQQELKRHLFDLEVSQVESDLQDGLRMSQALSRTVPIERVLLLTDGNVPSKIDFELPFELKYQIVGASAPNVGLTEFNAQRSGFERWDVFVRAEASAKHPASGTLRLFQDEELVGEEELILGSGESRRIAFEVIADRPTEVRAEITPVGDDALTSDNLGYLSLPAARYLKVYCPEDMPAFRHALKFAEGCVVYPNSLGNERPERFDLVFTESLDTHPEGSVLIYVGLVPERLAEMVEVKTGLAELVDWKRSDGLLRHVQLQDMQIADEVVYQQGFMDSDLEEEGFEIVAYGGAGPLIVKDRTSASQDYYLLFHPDRSTLPYRVAFPIMISNCTEMAFMAASLSEMRAFKTGVLPSLVLEPNKKYAVRGPDDVTKTYETGEDGLLNGVVAALPGYYSVLQESTQLERLGVSLLSSSESSLEAFEELELRELSVKAVEERLDVDRPLWPYFAWCGLAVLLVEWWYFQRPPVGV